MKGLTPHGNATEFNLKYYNKNYNTFFKKIVDVYNLMNFNFIDRFKFSIIYFYENITIILILCIVSIKVKLCIIKIYV